MENIILAIRIWFLPHQRARHTLLEHEPPPPPLLPSLAVMSSPSERSPLLGSSNGDVREQSFGDRALKALGLKGNQPSWLHSLKFLFLGSWFNIMLVFVPLSILSDRLHWDAAYRFGFSFIAIMPLAAVSGHLSTVSPAKCDVDGLRARNSS